MVGGCESGRPLGALSSSGVARGCTDEVTPPCFFTHLASPGPTSLLGQISHSRACCQRQGPGWSPPTPASLPPHYRPLDPRLSKKHWQQVGKGNAIVSTCREGGGGF